MRKFYQIITYIYNNFFTTCETILLLKKKDNFDLDIKNLGFKKITFKENLLPKLENSRLHKVNKYMNKLILNYETIKEIIGNIFIKNNLAKKITSYTGFSYSIDFFLAYETFSISSEDSSKPWFANHWHNDKPFTKNSLKILIPIDDINDEQDGGIEILNSIMTKEILTNKKKITDIKNEDIYRMIAKKNELVIFNANQCLHRAGNPKKNRVRRQIMMQLNPSTSWKINKKIQNKQLFREPKFPFFSYIFDTKENIIERL